MAEALAGVGAGVGIGIGYGVLSDYAKLGLTWAKWAGINAIDPNFFNSAFAKTLQGLLDAEKDPITGLSTKGMIDVMKGFIDSTIGLSLYIDPSIAQAMFVQMIHQSVAYAIHTSHAGAIGTVANVYSGSASLSTGLADNIAHDTDVIDLNHASFLSASVGVNSPTLSYALIRGMNQRFGEYSAKMMNDVEGIMAEWNDLSLAYYRQWVTLARERFANAITMKEDIVTRAYSIMEQMALEHLRRYTELIDTLQGAKTWWDTEDPVTHVRLITDEELTDMSLRVDLERQASEANFNDFLDSIQASITNGIVEWDVKITQALGDMTDTEEAFCKLLKRMLAPIFIDVANVVECMTSIADNILENVSAYRNVAKPISILHSTLPPYNEAVGYIPLVDVPFELEKDGLPFHPKEYIILTHGLLEVKA
jgi:hypothetical protein